MTKGHVIDTNVLAVADERHKKANKKCVRSCIKVLRDVRRENHLVLIDDQRLMLDEYRKQLPKNTKGTTSQKSPGISFYKWLHQNRENPDCCSQIKITPRASGGDFEEFPESKDLEGFDKDDRKFVAVALASKMDPVILNASDTDWWDYREALEAHGVRIRFLCQDLMEEQRRRGRK